MQLELVYTDRMQPLNFGAFKSCSKYSNELATDAENV